MTAPGPGTTEQRPGRVEEISSTANSKIKWIKSLSMKKNRDKENLFIAEGEKLITDALETGWSIKVMMYAESAALDADAESRIERLAARVRSSGADIYKVNRKILTSVTRRDNAQIVMAVMEQKTAERSRVLKPGSGIWLALDRVRDPGNLGTCIRTADALGVDGVILIGATTDPFSLETVRATMGSIFQVPIVRLDEQEFIDLASDWKSKVSGKIVGTHLKGAVDHREIDYQSSPFIVVMGNEQQGLTDALSGTCDQLALIAMEGAADSLNLAVATGIMLFEARRHELKATQQSAFRESGD